MGTVLSPPPVGVPPTRTLSTTAPLTIDGGASADLSANRTIAASGLAAIATNGSATSLIAGTTPAARMPALTGDVTSTVGTVATTITNDAVTYAKIQNVSATSRLLGRITAGAGDIEELTVAQVLSMLNLKPSDIGDGSDGSPVFDGTNTFAFASKSGSVYTLLRSVFFALPTINVGVTVKPDGWMFYSQQPIVNNGIIDISGFDAAGAVDATPAVSGSRVLPVSLSSGTASNVAPQVFVSSSAANAGGPGSGDGGSGFAGTIGTLGRGGGGGGGGNNHPFTAGGSAGSSSPSVTLKPDANGDVRVRFCAMSGRDLLNTVFTLGTWGGQGGAGGPGTAGGGRGAAGGWMAISAPAITGSGVISAKGGKGGDGTGNGAGVGGGGGGGGGAGGLIVLSLSGGANSNTTNVTGGAAGGGASGSGGGSGGNGGAGGAGYVLVI